MKTLMLAAAVCACGVVFGEVQASAPAAPADKTVVSVQTPAVTAKRVSKAKMTAEQRKEMLEKRRLAREAREMAAAKKAGLTLEQYRAEHKAKLDAVMAKRLGMTPEDYAKLSVDERRAKFGEMMRKVREAKQKKAPVVTPQEKKPVAAPAVAAPAAK